MKKIRFLILFVVSALVLAACQKNGIVTTVSDSITVKETTPEELYPKAEGEKKEANEKAQEDNKRRIIYLLKDGREGFIPQITLHENNNTFQFSYDPLSSYLAVGTYTVDHGQLELKTNDGKYHYTFDIADENTFLMHI